MRALAVRRCAGRRRCHPPPSDRARLAIAAFGPSSKPTACRRPRIDLVHAVIVLILATTSLGALTGVSRQRAVRVCVDVACTSESTAFCGRLRDALHDDEERIACRVERPDSANSVVPLLPPRLATGAHCPLPADRPTARHGLELSHRRISQYL